MNPVICLDPLFPDLSTEEKISRVAAQGFSHVEFWGWRDKNIAAIEALVARTGSGLRISAVIAREVPLPNPLTKLYLPKWRMLSQ